MEPLRTPTTVLNNQRLQALAISISVVSILLLVALVLIWRRFQREKVKKQQVGFDAKIILQFIGLKCARKFYFHFS
jgi:hypothetical protein